jgi:hypothetical protein
LVLALSPTGLLTLTLSGAPSSGDGKDQGPRGGFRHYDARVATVKSLIGSGDVINTATRAGFRAQGVALKTDLADLLGVAPDARCWLVGLSNGRNPGGFCVDKDHAQNCSHHAFPRNWREMLRKADVFKAFP